MSKLELLNKKVDAICKQMLLYKSRGLYDDVLKLEPIKNDIVAERNTEAKKNS